MTHVVTDACVLCKYTDCVDVCPVEAIFAEEDVPADQQEYIVLNAELSQKWPTITRSRDPLPDADKWKDVKNKIIHLIK